MWGLEKFVIDYKAHIQTDFFTQVAPYLRASDEEGKLKEYVRTQNPYDVLENCFNFITLANLAVKEKMVDISSSNIGERRELVGAMLENIGFKKEVNPSGLSQLRKELEPDLNQAVEDTPLIDRDIDGILAKMARNMEDLLVTLFLFHSGVLRFRAEEEDDSKVIESLSQLIKNYRKQKNIWDITSDS